jgi:hypothetical protein
MLGPTRAAALANILSLAILTLASSAVSGALPDPLSLQQALQGVEKHPATSATSALRSALPVAPSLYLDCERLAFASGEAAEPLSQARALLAPLAAQRLEVAERFFDVLLADQSFATESEAMAVAYVQYDRAKARQGLGQLSALKVLDLEAVYQERLHRRAASEASQQLTRARLAGARGRADELPLGLTEPDLPTLPDTLPASREWLAQALSGQAIAPLSAASGASDRALIELELGQQITALLIRLRVLAAARRSVQVESAWRDLKLDQSRTLYELEVTADLGYSMSQQTRTRMSEHRVEYCRALAWAELHELVGRPLWTADAKEP